MRWTKMNFRHNGWRTGYRYFTTWTGRQGLWGSGIGNFVRWLEQEYGPHRLYLAGPPTQEDLTRYYWTGWHLAYQPNPHWGKDTSKRRLYITEETLMWARLRGIVD